jgi:N-acyl-L-homoserine lactone synthetase
MICGNSMVIEMGGPELLKDTFATLMKSGGLWILHAESSTRVQISSRSVNIVY